MDRDSEDQEIITLTLRIVNSFSLFGSIFIIAAYFLLKIEMFSFRLVVYIAITDFLHSFCLLLPVYEPWCRVQAVMLEYSALSNIIWTSLMAYSLYDSVIRLNHHVEGKEKAFLFIGFLLPLVPTFLPFIDSSYGYSSGWCWITNKDTDYVYRVLCFYLILAFAIVFNLVVYCKVWRKVRNEVLFTIQDEEAAKFNNDLIMRLKLYPLILIVCYSFIATKRAYEIISRGEPDFWLTWTSGLLVSMIGLLDAIVYGISKEVRDKLKRFVCNRKQMDYSNVLDINDTGPKVYYI
jgi:hypothetical protein